MSTITRRNLGLLLLASTQSICRAAEPLGLSQPLPTLRGEYLSGRKAELPKDASGKMALLLMGFSYQSRFAVEAWTKRFREDFEKDTRVTFYEIPMIGGMARMGKWFIDSGMRRGTPKSDHENVITVYGGTDVWKKSLNVGDESLAYLILLDPTGRIVWRHDGKYDLAQYELLAKELRSKLP